MRFSSTLLALFLFTALAHADGVRFFQGSWSQLMAEARRQNKPIFVDVYTTWCGPCKLMTAQAFPNARVADRMNSNFINYKLDAEKGSGPGIVQRYGVQGYPTSLFLTSEGKLIRRSIGYNGVEGFLGEVRKALSDAQGAQAMIVWNNKYDAGERSPDFLRKMLLKQTEYDRATGDVLDDYVKTLPKSDTLANEEIKFLSDVLATTYTKAYLLLAQQNPRVLSDPAKRHLATPLAKALSRAFDNDFRDAVASQDEILLEGLIKQEAAMQRAKNPVAEKAPAFKEMQQQRADDFRLRFYRASRLPEHYRSLLIKIGDTRLMTLSPADLRRADSLAVSGKKDTLLFTDTNAALDSTQVSTDSAQIVPVVTPVGPTGQRPKSVQVASQLNQLAQSLVSHSSSKADLAKALRWSERAVQLDNSSANVLTYARLLTRSGRKVEARQHLRAAIAREQTGSDLANRLQAELGRI